LIGFTHIKNQATILNHYKPVDLESIPLAAMS